MVLTGTLYAATKGTLYEALFLNRICSFTSWGAELEQSPSHTSERCARGDFVDNKAS